MADDVVDHEHLVLLVRLFVHVVHVDEDLNIEEIVEVIHLSLSLTHSLSLSLSLSLYI